MNPFGIVVEKEAGKDLETLPPDTRQKILDVIRRYLSRNPSTPQGTRIKKLHHLKLPLYRLRVGDYRVYYRIRFREAVILAVLNRKESDCSPERFQ